MAGPELTDFQRLIPLITRNLQAKECPKTRKVGCIGECEGCPKRATLDHIYGDFSEDVLFNADYGQIEEMIEAEKLSDDANDWISPDAKEVTREERIEVWKKYYESVDFGDNWSDYMNCDPINETNAQGKSLLHLAVEEDNIEKIKRLIAEGIDPSIKDNSGYTAADIALLEGKRDIIVLLSALGILE